MTLIGQFFSQNKEVNVKSRPTSIVVTNIKCICVTPPPQPDVIVHCAAERRPDIVERHTEAAINLNVHATSVLAKEAGQDML